jgi:hypothetical protein
MGEGTKKVSGKYDSVHTCSLFCPHMFFILYTHVLYSGGQKLELPHSD